jgi:hypothetical protein
MTVVVTVLTVCTVFIPDTQYDTVIIIYLTSMLFGFIRRISKDFGIIAP